jgi:hypothetical protein
MESFKKRKNTKEAEEESHMMVETEIRLMHPQAKGIKQH